MPFSHHFGRRLATALLICFCEASAGTLGDLTYEIVGGTEVTITDCASSATGVLVVPDTIESLPVTTIGSNAFYNCDSLTSVDLPASIATLGYNAFADCDGITSISIPASLSSIGSAAFGRCDMLDSVTFEDGCTEVAATMFTDCPALTSVTLPDGMLTIGYGAFQMCDGLISITIPSSVTEINDTAFSQCSSLLGINVDATNTTYASIDGVLFSKDLTSILNYPSGKSGAYVIPSSVSEIDTFCFEYCVELSAVTIPTSVTKIDGWAFRGCTGLTSITIPTSVSSLGYSVFFGCDGLTSVVIPASITSIGPKCFSDCQQLASITVDAGNANYSSTSGVLFNIDGSVLITCPAGKSGSYSVPQGVGAIGDSAFYACKQITAIHMHNGITLIEDRAFYDCDGLESLAFPTSATISGEYTCSFSSNLVEVTLPTNLITIPEGMFNWCASLETITFPGGLQIIGESAFNECNSLTKIVFPASLVELKNDSFHDCDYLTEIYFLGDAPIMGTSSYEATQIFDRWSGYPDGAIYYLSGSAGFTSPTWHGYESIQIDQTSYPAASWLLTHDLAYDQDLTRNLNNDGVILLMEYALNLDPAANNAGNLPDISINGSNAEIRFYGLSDGITYQVFTSTDLTNWTTDGVTLSSPDAEGIRTASIPTTGDCGFLRLEASD